MIDGLFENDKYGNLIPSLAKDWDSFARWLDILINFIDDVNGMIRRRKCTDVTAKNFSQGSNMRLITNQKCSIIQDSIKGLVSNYVSGKNKDFSSCRISS